MCVWIACSLASVLQRLAFFVSQPACLVGLVGQEKINDKAKQHGRQGPRNEHPLPTHHAENRLIGSHADRQQQIRYLGIDELRDGRAGKKDGRHTTAIARGKPVTQKDDHPGHKSRLGKAQ
jgi:hypothetical protein